MEEFTVHEEFFSVNGFVAPGYESVGQVFSHQFRVGQETNAQCCVYVGGKVVVDLWGTSKEAKTRDYDGDSIQVTLFVIVKGNSSKF